MRTFDTGATRDTDENKPDYEGFLSPLVLVRYGEYMMKHQVQTDGDLRSSDNWQKGFGADHYAVCMKSLLRHTTDAWMFHRGFNGRDYLEDALCGIMFNAMAYLHQLLLKGESNDGTEV